MQRDYKLGALAGFLTGICLVPTAWNIGTIGGINLQNPVLIIILPLVSLVGIVFGIWLGKILGRAIPVVTQISKFAAVGFLNTAINFAVLNILSIITGQAAGLSVGEYNIPATAVAATNSYFWNKYWVFKGVSRGSASDPVKFFIVTAIGLLARSGVLYFVTTFVSHGDLSKTAWLNVANVLATLVGIMVDYLGYKFLVFVRKSR
ncbi:MAG: GtrA family protein [Candidatus Doudnabacteria bacterium]|nr:GtrA family protein [Candidatus Doudnabacteria bacterium]